MRCGMNNGEEQQRICELPVHPDVLIKRDKPNLGPDEAHDCPADRQQDEHAIDAQNQTSSSRHPYGILQCVETRKAGIALLLPPSICEDAPVECPEQDMEYEFGGRELLPEKREERHLGDVNPPFCTVATRLEKVSTCDP